MPATAPGHGTKQTNSLRAHQKLTVMDSFNKSSYYPAEPAIGFGTSARLAMSFGDPTPGPGAYPLKSTLFKHFDSTITNPAEYTLKSRQKFGDPYLRALDKTTAAEPGPGHYNTTDKFLAGTNPRKSGFPKAGFPRDKAQLAPGPGAYKLPGSMGKQVLSVFPALPAPVFTAAGRENGSTMNSVDIGPGEYGPPPGACEPQVDSRKRTCATIKFGRGYRKGPGLQKEKMMEPSPGPGAYVIPGGVCTAARGTPFRSAPAISLSGREKFGSPW